MARGGFTIKLMDRQSRDTIRQVDGWRCWWNCKSLGYDWFPAIIILLGEHAVIITLYYWCLAFIGTAPSATYVSMSHKNCVNCFMTKTSFSDSSAASSCHYTGRDISGEKGLNGCHLQCNWIIAMTVKPYYLNSIIEDANFSGNWIKSLGFSNGSHFLKINWDSTSLLVKSPYESSKYFPH